MREKDVIAILLGDIHLSHTAPPSYLQADWYPTMKRNLDQVEALRVEHECPVVCSGDVFDRWNSPVELVNFAWKHLPPMHAVPGQHDLPYHNYDLWAKSAYGNLVLSGRIKQLTPEPTHYGDLMMYGFPWGYDITPPEHGEYCINLAVVHKYVWIKGKSFPGAKTSEKALSYKEVLKGYDAAVFGDNHKGFKMKVGGCELFNNGTFMRRKSDELDYRPQVGLLKSDGSIRIHGLDTSKDEMHIVAGGMNSKTGRFDDFISELKNSNLNELDYAQAIHRKVEEKGVSENTRNLLLESIEK